jgi:hypothetical protein
MWRMSLWKVKGHLLHLIKLLLVFLRMRILFITTCLAILKTTHSTNQMMLSKLFIKDSIYHLKIQVLSIQPMQTFQIISMYNSDRAMIFKWDNHSQYTTINRSNILETKSFNRDLQTQINQTISSFPKSRQVHSSLWSYLNKHSL